MLDLLASLANSQTPAPPFVTPSHVGRGTSGKRSREMGDTLKQAGKVGAFQGTHSSRPAFSRWTEAVFMRPGRMDQKLSTDLYDRCL